MAYWNASEICSRHRHADDQRGQMQAYIDEAMDFGIPWARDPSKGRMVFDRLFDSSGPWGVAKFAGRVQRDLTPHGSRWFELEAGPLVPPDQRDGINRSLELGTSICHAALNASAFHHASSQMYSHLAIGTGALLGAEGDDRNPINWTAVPAWGLGIEEGPDGRIENVYWRRHYPAWQLGRRWPQAEWPKDVRELIAQRSTQLVDVLQATYYHPEARGWVLAICLMGGPGTNGQPSNGLIVFEKLQRTNPWIIPRWWTTPGMPWGIGPLLLTLPDIKTANKAVEMILKAAALNLAPPLMVLHDGVVNPDNLRIAPHALIRVARTGGNLGRSIEPLDMGSRVDLTQISLEDARQSIARNLLARELPPATGSVRSPTEIIERIKDLQEDTGPAFGRLSYEYVPGVIARTIDILDRKGLPVINFDEMRVDELTLRVKITSPMAMQQNLADVESAVRWLELARAVGGEELYAIIADVERALIEMRPLMGARSWVAKSDADREATKQAASQAAAALAAIQTDTTGAGPGQVVDLVRPAA